MEDVNKYMGIVEKHLAGNKFLVGEGYSIADLSLAASVSVIFSVMLGEGPRKKYSNTMKWYLMMTEINPEVGPKDLPKEADDAFKGGKKGKKEEEKPKKEKKKEEKKEEKKEQKKEQKKAADDDDDLFGDDDTPAAPKEVPKPVVKKKEGKKKATPKSIVVFDVKVYDQETDLNQLFEKVKTISLDGLVWNNEPKILPVAFGMNKLQCGCVIEDEKINTDDIFEKIEDWEEVQSTDVVSFQKL
jgi:translation elongation factor EF-1beta